MIDSITSKISGADFSNGNTIQSMFDIAKNVVAEVEDDIEDEADLKSTKNTISDILQEISSENSNNNNNKTSLMPFDLGNFMKIFNKSVLEENESCQSNDTNDLNEVKNNSCDLIVNETINETIVEPINEPIVNDNKEQNNEPETKKITFNLTDLLQSLFVRRYDGRTE